MRYFRVFLGLFGLFCCSQAFAEADPIKSLYEAATIDLSVDKKVCPDFSGSWTGVCVSVRDDGTKQETFEKEETIAINQKGCGKFQFMDSPMLEVGVAQNTSYSGEQGFRHERIAVAWSETDPDVLMSFGDISGMRFEPMAPYKALEIVGEFKLVNEGEVKATKRMKFTEAAENQPETKVTVATTCTLSK